MSDDKNTKEKFEELKKAAEQGHADAQCNLGVCYEKGYGVEKDLKQAVEWWTKAAEQGHVTAQYNLGVAYVNAYGVEKDLKQAVKWYKKAAEQGNAKAQCNLGVCYNNGDGVKKDLEEAVKWYKKAAKQGQAVAQYNLAVCYKNGRGVKQDLKEVVEWWTKAAKQGDVNAQYHLGNAYLNGDGVEKNLEKAVEWWIKAAKQGHADAQHNLGVCYEDGDVGTAPDLKEAVKWYKKAAKQGQADAQYNLGVCYENGDGVKKDLEEAVKWYKKAVKLWTTGAEQGHAQSQFYLGVCYENGEGVEKKLQTAVKYYKMSFNGGFEIKGKEKLPPLAKIISIIHKIFKEQRVDENKLKSIASITHFTSVDVLKKLLEDPNEKKGLEDPNENKGLEDPNENKGFLRIQNIDGCNDPMEGKTLYEWLKIDGIVCSDMNDSYPLILSMCEGSPENLPMWNTYADNSNGVALGIKKDSLKKYTQSNKHYIMYGDDSDKNATGDKKNTFSKEKTKDELLPMLYNVLYINRDPNKSTKLLAKLKRAIKKNKPEDKELIAEYIELIADLLIELSHIVKYDDYEYEKEIRLVRFAFKADIWDKNNPLKNCSDSHRVYMEAEHIKYEVITTAPKVSEKMYKYIKYLGDKNKIDKVIKSKISYR